MITAIYIENNKLDLFKDESIELNSSITNIDDITKNTTEYTKSFTVPATRNNNIIFKHYYNATIDNTFDARVKVSSRIELGGIPFKFGKLKLEKVNVKQNKPSSYTINFRGNLVSLKEKFRDDELSSLDLSEFDHEFNSDKVKDGLTSYLSSGNVIYNLLSRKQLYYYGHSSDNTNTETLANIAYSGGYSVGVKWFELKPSIKISKIIEAIQSKYNIIFSDDFFGRTEISDIFIWLNSESESASRRNEQLIEYSTGHIDDYGYNFTTFTWNETQDLTPTQRYYYRVFVTPTDLNVPYKVVVKNNDIPVAEFSAVGNFESDYVAVPLVNGADTPFSYKFYISSEFGITYNSTLQIKKGITTSKTGDNTTQTIIDAFIISENMPKIKIIDFLKGLFSMFKLVVIADQYDNVYVNTLNDYYAQGKLYDITRYVDFSSYDVERGNILNVIKFNFAEPSTLLNTQFKLNTEIAYGDEETVLEDESGQMLDGDEFVVELPFEQIVYERLNDLYDNTKTNIMYGGVFNESIQGVNPKPHLFYNSNQDLGSKTVAFIDDTNTKTEITSLNIPLHTYGIVEPQFSLLFSQEFNEWDGLLINNTLYSNYYKQYIDSIFNIKRRTFRFNCKQLPFIILTKLQLNDILKIRNDYYRISSFNTNLLTKEISFVLINSFNNNVQAVTSSRLQVVADYKQQTQSVYVTNINNKDYSYTASWLTVSSVNDNVYFEFDQNTDADARTATVTIYDTVTLKKVDIYVLQYPETL